MLRIILCLALSSSVPAFAQTDAPDDATAAPAVAPEWSGPAIAPLLADLALPEPWGTSDEWVAWPDEGYVVAHAATRDRGDEFPPVYPDPERRVGKPARQGARPPQGIRGEAAWWTGWCIAERWLVDDYEHALRLVQTDDAGDSFVLYGASSDLGRLWARQNLWGICVVFEPKPELIEGVAPDQYPRVLFPLVFKWWERMADTVPELTVQDGPFFYAANPKEGGFPEWMHWCAWYTDGRSIAVFLRKRTAASPWVVLPGDPWF